MATFYSEDWQNFIPIVGGIGSMFFSEADKWTFLMDSGAEILDDYGFAMTAHANTASHVPYGSALAYVSVLGNLPADLLRAVNTE